MPPPTTTYGKRSVKRKTNDHADASALNSTTMPTASDDDELLLQSTRPVIQKKRKIEPTRGTPGSAKGELPHPIEDGAESKPKNTTAHSTPMKVSTLGANLIESPSKPSKRECPIFQNTGSGPQPQPVPQASPIKTGSPTKLAKRMLSRSKTETAVEGPGNPFLLADNRSPSMPTLSSPREDLSPFQPPSRSPTRTNTSQDVTSATAPTDPSSSILHRPASASRSSTSKSLSRTYAGRSRSYLVPLGPTNGLDDVEEDDEFSRESYATLRQRWGVDESEDDPHHLIADDDLLSGQSPVQSPSKARAAGGRTPLTSPSKGKSKAGVQQPKPPPLPPNMMNPLKSITELRNKGESRRFLDEVAYLLDGMDKSQGAGLIRSSALEMVTKLCDGDFFRKSKAADVFSKIYDLLVGVGVGRGDKVLDTLFVLFAVLVSKDPSSLTDLASQAPETPDAKGKGRASLNSLSGTLFSLLESNSASDFDPLVLVAPEGAYADAELRRAGLGKKEKATMVSILSIIRKKSGIFPADAKITTPLLITRVLVCLPPAFIFQHHLPALLNSLRQTLRPLEAWRTKAASKLALDEPVGFENVYAHLRLLDLYLLGQWALDDRSSQQDEGPSANDSALNAARQEWLVSALIALGVHAEMVTIKGKEDNKSSVDCDGGTRCLESVLRVLVSLTHGDEGWARSVALDDAWALRFLTRIVARAGEEVAKGRDEVAEGVAKTEEGDGYDESERAAEVYTHVSSREKKAKSLDRLCLSLALLTNLVQTIAEVKDVVRETYLDPLCTLRKAQCLDDCSCYQANNVSVLDILVRLYVRQGVDQEHWQIKKDSDHEDSLQVDADASFLRGHLAVLFGLCMRGNATNQKALLNLLPGPQSNPKVKLNRLVDQARQFVSFFEIIEGQAQGSQRESSSRTGVEILCFLEDLRDGAS